MAVVSGLADEDDLIHAGCLVVEQQVTDLIRCADGTSERCDSLVDTVDTLCHPRSEAYSDLRSCLPVESKEASVGQELLVDVGYPRLMVAKSVEVA